MGWAWLGSLYLSTLTWSAQLSPSPRWTESKPPQSKVHWYRTSPCNGCDVESSRNEPRSFRTNRISSIASRPSSQPNNSHESHPITIRTRDPRCRPRPTRQPASPPTRGQPIPAQPTPAPSFKPRPSVSKRIARQTPADGCPCLASRNDDIRHHTIGGACFPTPSAAGACCFAASMHGRLSRLLFMLPRWAQPMHTASSATDMTLTTTIPMLPWLPRALFFSPIIGRPAPPS
ncbi:uncharacterized protein J3D65DRAFT_635839 [Phyllosticta citribraziliensis]|uniref:Secreted protein n=1 Tax=Phyllosticta citribraziliensis TaxID=989973 RepID=A0ABR1LA61_9PEZI